jgi:acetate kinase
MRRWQGMPMKTAKPCILTINSGSSSIKFALFEADAALLRLLQGGVRRIGLPQTSLWMQGSDPIHGFSRQLPASAPALVVAALVQLIDTSLADLALVAVVHRIVQGGPGYSAPQWITAAMIEQLQRLTAFDPEHLPLEILLIEAFQSRFALVPQLACFDTAFHHELPRIAQLLPIPRRFEAQGLRRYGFHGLSYAFLMQELARLAGPDAAQGRVILAHLGSGASLAAVYEGKPMDTSMSFTPASGLPMSTRSGDLDPGLLCYLALAEGLDARQLNHMVNFESGLLGVSGTSPDMGELLAREAGDVRAAEAVALFCYQTKKWIGSFTAVLGGLDALIFSGGIGENAPLVRARICEGLGFLGLELDTSRNLASADVISGSNSRVTVRVIKTDEEVMMAQLFLRFSAIGNGGTGKHHVH